MLKLCSHGARQIAKKEKEEKVGKNGTLHVAVRYLPFVSAEEQEEIAKKLEASRRKDAILGPRSLSRSLSRKSMRTVDMRGVLSVTVHRCLNLEVGQGAPEGLSHVGCCMRLWHWIRHFLDC